MRRQRTAGRGVSSNRLYPTHAQRPRDTCHLPTYACVSRATIQVATEGMREHVAKANALRLPHAEYFNALFREGGARGRGAHAPRRFMPRTSPHAHAHAARPHTPHASRAALARHLTTPCPGWHARCARCGGVPVGDADAVGGRVDFTPKEPSFFQNTPPLMRIRYAEYLSTLQAWWRVLTSSY